MECIKVWLMGGIGLRAISTLLPGNIIFPFACGLGFECKVEMF